MFGLSGSGKTCYLYAMAQVMSRGVKCGDDMQISALANEVYQQQALFDGYDMMAIDKRWPSPSNSTTEYDLNFCLLSKDYKHIPNVSVLLYDYAGGIWQNPTHEGENERRLLMENFKDSDALIFIVDSETVKKAMLDNPTIPDCLRAQQQVSLVQNLFNRYKREYLRMPPVLLCITKGDLFESKEENEKAYEYLRDFLPSIFAIGSNVDAALTTVALGDNLTNNDSELSGELTNNLEHNIHIPMLYALYAYYDSIYKDCTPGEQKLIIDTILPVLRRLFVDKIIFYINGEHVAID